MRLFLSILAISVVLPSVGCSSNLKCRRETALLRAEYLDLEDKYYALLANSGPTPTPRLGSALPTNSPGAYVANAQPTIYGAGVQPGMNSVPEITYYDQSNNYPPQGYPAQGYPAQGYPVQSYPDQGYPNQAYSDQGYPVQGYPVESYPVQGDPYNSTPQYGQTPTPANSPELEEYDDDTSLRSSLSADSPDDNFFPSPVETGEANTESREPEIQSQSDDLPTPNANLDDNQSRLNIEIENTHEIGHETEVTAPSSITEVVINKSVSQGKNSDGNPGDDGIAVLLQPKSADGSVVDEAGNLTISLIDPAADQGERQVGQWTFLKEEAVLFFAEDEFDNRGILLDLKWDKIIPTNKRLTVYVRFVTSDDRIMETTSDIIIDPPSDLTLTEQSGDYDSKFTRLEKDDVQGWYKSQTGRSGNRERRTSSDSSSWGRSEVSIDQSFSPRQSARPNRQPTWRRAN